MMTTKAQADIRRKLKILNHGKENGNVSRHVGTLASPEKRITNGKEIMKRKVKPP
jgi:hypothetical protein